MAEALPAHVTTSPDVLFKDVGGEGVLLNLASERYYILDDVGVRMWQLLTEYNDVDTVVERLLAEYDVDEETLRQDLGRLIGELAEADLISVLEPQ